MNTVIKIKATGTVAWSVAIMALTIEVIIVIGSGGTGAPVSSLVGVGAVSVLGLPTAISAVLIAVAAGGVGSLNSLRKYKIIEQSDTKLVLKRQ